MRQLMLVGCLGQSILQANTLTVSATADTCVSSGNRSTSYGSNTSMVVGIYEGTWYAYIRFSRGDLSQLQGKTITNVELRLYMITHNLASSIRLMITDSDSFSESDTYNSRPNTRILLSTAYNTGTTTGRKRLDLQDNNYQLRDFIRRKVADYANVYLGLESASSSGFTNFITEEGNYPAELVITYEEPNLKPVISSISPTSGKAGTAVTISGSNLNNPSSVTFYNGVTASVQSSSSSSITAIVPSGTTTEGSVLVTNSYGSTASDQKFMPLLPVLVKVKSRDNPYEMVPGVTIGVGTSNTTTGTDGTTTIYLSGNTYVSAQKTDYWAVNSDDKETKLYSVNTSGANELVFDKFLCKSTPTVGLTFSKNPATIGDTVVVTYTMTHSATLTDVATYGDVSFNGLAGTPEKGSWNSVTVYPIGAANVYGINGLLPSSRVVDTLVSGYKSGPQSGTMTFSFPYVVTGPLGRVDFKCRGTTGQRHIPSVTGTGTMDQQGYNVQVVSLQVQEGVIGLRVGLQNPYSAGKPVTIPITTDVAGCTVAVSLEMLDGTKRNVPVMDAKLVLALGAGNYPFTATASKANYRSETVNGTIIVQDSTFDVSLLTEKVYSDTVSKIEWKNSEAITGTTFQYVLKDDRGSVVKTGSTSGFFIDFTPLGTVNSYTLELTASAQGYAAVKKVFTVQNVNILVTGPTTVTLGEMGRYTILTNAFSGNIQVTKNSTVQTLTNRVYETTFIGDYPYEVDLAFVLVGTSVKKVLSVTVQKLPPQKLTVMPTGDVTIWMGDKPEYKVFLGSDVSRTDHPFKVTINGTTEVSGNSLFSAEFNIAKTYTLVFKGNDGKASEEEVRILTVRPNNLAVSPVGPVTIKKNETLNFVISGAKYYTVDDKNLDTQRATQYTSAVATHTVTYPTTGKHELTFAAAGSPSVVRQVTVIDDTLVLDTKVTASADRASIKPRETVFFTVDIANAANTTHTLSVLVGTEIYNVISYNGTKVVFPVVLSSSGTHNVTFLLDNKYVSNTVVIYVMPAELSQMRSMRQLLVYKVLPTAPGYVQVKNGDNWSIITHERLNQILSSDTFRETQYVLHCLGENTYAILDMRADDFTALDSFVMGRANIYVPGSTVNFIGSLSSFFSLPYAEDTLGLFVLVSFADTSTEMYIMNGDPAFLMKREQYLKEAGFNTVMMFVPDLVNRYLKSPSGQALAKTIDESKFVIGLEKKVGDFISKTKNLVVKYGLPPIGVPTSLDKYLSKFQIRTATGLISETAVRSFLKEMEATLVDLEAKGIRNAKVDTQALLDTIDGASPTAVAQLNHLNSVLAGLANTIKDEGTDQLRRLTGAAEARISRVTVDDLNRIVRADSNNPSAYFGEDYARLQMKILGVFDSTTKAVTEVANHWSFYRVGDGNVVSGRGLSNYPGKLTSDIDFLLQVKGSDGTTNYVVVQVKSAQDVVLDDIQIHVSRDIDSTLISTDVLYSGAIMQAEKQITSKKAFYDMLTDVDMDSLVRNTLQEKGLTHTPGAKIYRLFTYIGGTWRMREGLSLSRMVGLSILAISDAVNGIVSGFTLKNQTGKLVIRGVGPGLKQFINNYGKTPSLTLYNLHDGTSTIINMSDDWRNSSQAVEMESEMQQAGLFALDKNGQDAVVLVTLKQGAYTVKLTNSSSSESVLLEVYCLDGTISNLSNMSSQVRIEPGLPSITGITIPAEQILLIRAVAETLGVFGVENPAEDPSIKVYDNNGQVIAENDDWVASQELTEAQVAVGAFPLRSGSKESILLKKLPAGTYTIHANVTKKGMVLVEVYRYD